MDIEVTPDELMTICLALNDFRSKHEKKNIEDKSNVDRRRVRESTNLLAKYVIHLPLVYRVMIELLVEQESYHSKRKEINYLEKMFDA